MNARQEAKLSMFRSTEKHCIDNATIMVTIPAFQTAVQSFSAVIVSILDAVQKEEMVIYGITMDKAAVRKKLCQLTFDTAAPIAAFASVNNNNQLLHEVNFSYTDLFKTKDDLLAPKCSNVCKAAINNLSALAVYGITQSTINTLQAVINTYQAKVPDPRNAAAQKMTIRNNIKNLIKQADNILSYQMDKTIVGFKSTHPNFVTAYTINRVIIDPGTTATQIKGTITESSTAIPISGVQVQVTDSVQKTISTIKGTFTLKHLKSNTYSITISKEGYQSQTINNIEVKLGQATIVNIILTILA